MRHLATTETQSDFHLVAVFEKLEDIAHLDVIVVAVCVGTELDLFDLDDLLLLAGFALALLLFVFELAEIHDFAHGRRGIGRDFNQVKPGFVCHVHGLHGCDDSDVFAVGADQADFVGADLVVDARAGVALRRRVMGSASDGGRPLVVADKLRPKPNLRGRPLQPRKSAMLRRNG